MTFEKYLKEVYPRYMPEMTRTQLMDLAAAAIVSDDCTMGFYLDPTEKKVVYNESDFGPVVDLYMILLAIKATYQKLCIAYPDKDFTRLADRMISMIWHMISEEDANG